MPEEGKEGLTGVEAAIEFMAQRDGSRGMYLLYPSWGTCIYAYMPSSFRRGAFCCRCHAGLKFRLILKYFNIFRFKALHNGTTPSVAELQYPLSLTSAVCIANEVGHAPGRKRKCFCRAMRGRCWLCDSFNFTLLPGACPNFLAIIHSRSSGAKHRAKRPSDTFVYQCR